MLHYTTSNSSILQLSHWIRGSQPEKIQELKQITSDDSTFGVGKAFCHSLPIWRKIIQQAWLAGLLRRNMKTGSGDQHATNILFNVFTPTEEGTNYALNPSPLLLPSFNPDDPPATDQDVDKAQTKNAAKHRNGKGCQILPKSDGFSAHKGIGIRSGIPPTTTFLVSLRLGFVMISPISASILQVTLTFSSMTYSWAKTRYKTRVGSKLILMAWKNTSLLPVRGLNIVRLMKLTVTTSPVHEKVAPVRTILGFH